MPINKFISEAGKSSRRGADKLIEEGRIFVNGKRAKLGSRVERGDDVRLDGIQLYVARNNVYIALNKPVGITSTTEKMFRVTLLISLTTLSEYLTLAV